MEISEEFFKKKFSKFSSSIEYFKKLYKSPKIQLILNSKTHDEVLDIISKEVEKTDNEIYKHMLYGHYDYNKEAELDMLKQSIINYIGSEIIDTISKNPNISVENQIMKDRELVYLFNL
jgi:hypothetical protein